MDATATPDVKPAANATAATTTPEVDMSREILHLIDKHDIDTLRAEYAKGDERDGGKLNINALHPFFGTPLNYALRYENIDCLVDQLLEWSADVNIGPANSEMIPLASAAFNGSLNHIRQLCEHGADVNAMMDDAPIIFRFIVLGSWMAIEIMGEFGLNVNVRNDDGETPLIFAIKRRFAMVISILIKLGADISLRDNEGRSAMDIVKKGGLSDITDILQRAQGAYIKAAR